MTRIEKYIHQMCASHTHEVQKVAQFAANKFALIKRRQQHVRCICASGAVGKADKYECGVGG